VYLNEIALPKAYGAWDARVDVHRKSYYGFPFKNYIDGPNLIINKIYDYNYLLNCNELLQ
jgi:hypothetical protein